MLEVCSVRIGATGIAEAPVVAATPKTATAANTKGSLFIELSSEIIPPQADAQPSLRPDFGSLLKDHSPWKAFFARVKGICPLR
jgi:hypothetical protein